jgi:hypothetical protein
MTGNAIRFGYTGQHTDFREGITAEDARWLIQYLGRLSDEQLSVGLTASGASQADATCFTRELRKRIEMLRQVAR